MAGHAEFTAEGVVVMGGDAIEVRGFVSGPPCPSFPVHSHRPHWSLQVREMPGIGGGRGVFARRAIKVGEVVLEEAPLVRALPTHQKSEEGTVRSTDEPLHMQLTRRVLQDPDRDTLLGQMTVLYPRAIDDMDADVYKRAKRHHADSVDKLVDQQRAAAPPGLPPLGKLDSASKGLRPPMLACVLTLRWTAASRGRRAHCAAQSVLQCVSGRYLHQKGHVQSQLPS